MKNKNVKNTIILTLCSIVVFSFGLAAGLLINNRDSINLQGYMLRNRLPNRGIASNSNASTSNASTSNASTSNASTSNASTSNASTSNASTSNASTSNASTANASSANASINDNILFLDSLSFDVDTAHPGDRVNVTIRTSGACNSGATLVLESDNGLEYTLPVKNLTADSHIILPNNMMEGPYSISKILLIGTNSDGKTFTKTIYVDKNQIIKIVNDKKEETKDYKLTTLKLNDNTAKQGEKVYLDLKSSEPITELKLTFVSKNGKEISFFAKDLNTKIPYIDISSSVEPGKYELDKAVVSFKDTTKIYTRSGRNNTEKFAFNSTIEIEEAEETYIYNNEDVNDEILSKLYSAPDGTTISIHADSKSFVESEVFETIKGKDKDLVISYKDNQIVFNGKDITNPKTIDVSITVDSVENNEAISKLVDSGIVVNFSDNGDLPGDALVKIKATEEIDRQLKNGGYVYYYNKINNNFIEIKTKLEKSADGYYTFNIKHNSDYLLVNKELPSSIVAVEDTVDGVNFIKSNRVYLALIALGILVIVAVVIFIIVKKKKDTKKTKNKKDKDKDKDKEKDKE